jgi:uncharacterized protein (UPF0261 family)
MSSPADFVVEPGKAAYVAGTFDTKGPDLRYLASCIEALGIRTVTVDLSTLGHASGAQVQAAEVARSHPQGVGAVFSGDRGTAVAAMAVAFERFLASRDDVAGIVSAGGSGGTALATPAMRQLPVGVPKVMVSTIASGDVRPYVGPSDICMMYSVTDVAGINRISEQVLANAAHALAGMIGWRKPGGVATRPAIGLSMFGVTTPCVTAVSKRLDDRYDCLVFHATGTGGQSMEKLADSGLLCGLIDVTTTEVADELVGGVLPSGADRFGSVIRSRLPYVGSCGALDMVNFWAPDTVPAKFKAREFYRHNPNVTLMRTDVDENRRFGQWIAERLNRMLGPVRFVFPQGGLSALDAPGQPFWNPDADDALWEALKTHFVPAANRRLIAMPLHINDAAFAAALVAQFEEIVR